MKLIFKLATGEDVIGDVPDYQVDTSPFVSINGPEVEVSDPMVVMSRWAQDGSLQMGFVPFMPFCDENKITIYTVNTVVVAKPHIDLEKEYVTKTSGILLP